MKILITGAAGLVGRALTDHCRESQDEVFPYDRASLDISDYPQVERIVSETKPEVVINCAAWTDVDGCERDIDRCEAVNALGPENLAKASKSVAALLITISTDYVFDGRKEGFYTQRDDPNPLGVYARAKLAGERRSQIHYARTIVVRTGFVFGEGGRNFLSNVLDMVKRGERVKAICDAWGTPTYARDLAVRLRELAVLDLPAIFHVVNSGAGASYDDFARLITKTAGYDDACLETVLFDSLKRLAPRPRNSRLRCLMSESLGLRPLPTWQDGLGRFIASSQERHTQKVPA